MKLKNLLKRILCFGVAATLSLGFAPSIAASAQGYPAVDMFEQVRAMNGNGYLKGVQGAVDRNMYAYTDSTGTHGLSHSFWNAYLNDMIFRKPVDGAEEFTFEGKTYWFNFAPIEAFIKTCNSQAMTCNIQFMLKWDGSPDQAWLVDPKARVVNPNPVVAQIQMYAMDVAGDGRQAYRAFWRALMAWCARNGYHIDQFILGNEVNAPNTWNYFGTLDINTCTEKYSISFIDMYQAVREYSSVPRCSVCLDHSWIYDDMGNAISTKTFLDNFHARVTALNGGEPVDWCLSMHLWPARINWTPIWTPWPALGIRLATDSENTFLIDGSNVHILTDYIKSRFGTQHRVMMTEQGFVQDQGEQAQAASLAYSYYACLYNDMVDNFIIFDANGDGQMAALLPLAQEVFQKIGSPDAADRQRIAEICLPVIGVSSWEQIIPNFGGSTGSAPVSGTVQAGGRLKELFDEHYYADAYPDLKAVYGYDREALWAHFINSGLKEGRVMNGRLDVVKYRNTYADLNAAFGDNWDAYVEHFLTCGEKEGRDSGIEADR